MKVKRSLPRFIAQTLAAIKKKDIMTHIGFSCPDHFTDNMIDDFLSDIRDENLEIKLDKRPLTPFAAVDWAIPTIIAIYIFKPYFEEFLKEAGKEHYHKLSNWLKKTFRTGKLIKVKTMTASGSENKLNKGYSQSKAISLWIQTKNGKRIKVLFDNDLDIKDWEDAIDVMLDFVIDNYEKYPNDSLTNNIKDLEQDTRLELFAVIDKNTKKWIFYDYRNIREHKI